MRLLEFFDTVFVRDKRLQVQPARRHRTAILHFIKDNNDIRLDDFSAERVNHWIETTPRRLLPKTMRRRVNDVLAVWSWAYEVSATSVPMERQRIGRIEIPRTTPTPWTLDEIRRMLDACRSMTLKFPAGVTEGECLRAVILVGFYAAVRVITLKRLRRDDLHSREEPIDWSQPQRPSDLAIVPRWVVEDINAMYPRRVSHVFAWPHRGYKFKRRWQVMIGKAGLEVCRRNELGQLRKSAIEHGRRVHPDFGEALADHLRGSPITYRFAADPRVLNRKLMYALPDLREE